MVHNSYNLNVTRVVRSFAMRRYFRLFLSLTQQTCEKIHELCVHVSMFFTHAHSSHSVTYTQLHLYSLANSIPSLTQIYKFLQCLQI